MSWEDWQGQLDDKDVIVFGSSTASPPSVAHIMAFAAFAGVILFAIVGFIAMWITGNRPAANGFGFFILGVHFFLYFVLPRGPFKPYRFADSREWALTKDGLYFENRAFIPAAALTRVGGFGGFFVLHFKENGTDACHWLHGGIKNRRLRAALREMIRERKDVTV
ncbi:MAG: hypothetical protein RID11_00825 [Roseovarius sp.]|uniref:hypothetical protein n=1 Tax=Roseovarius sp. TaxID=1486281 RepID=UPI0032EAC098